MTARVLTLFTLLILLISGYTVLCLLLYLTQERLLFPAPPLDAAAAVQLARQRPGSAYSLRTADGETLHGWLDVPPGSGPHPLLLYFGGNAEEVSGWMMERARLPEWAWAAVNYRGYGASSGRPSEAALSADARQLFDALARDPRVDADRMVLVGRRLGSGVAVPLAARRPVRAVVLLTPFDSALAVAHRHHPYAPVRWLLRHPFDSLSLAGGVTTPALVLLAEGDALIPPEHGQRLADAWGGPMSLLRLAGADHASVLQHPEAWPAIQRFLLPFSR
jgi:hypothetical protein